MTLKKGLRVGIVHPAKQTVPGNVINMCKLLAGMSKEGDIRLLSVVFSERTR